MQMNIKNSHFLLTAASAYSNYLSLLRRSTYQRLRSPTKKPRSIVCVIPSRMHGPRAVSLGSWFPPNFFNGSFGSRFFFLQGKPLGSCVKARALYRAPARPGASSPSAQSGDALYRRLSADRDADAGGNA